MYRELAPAVIEDDTGGCAGKQTVLDACEEALRRLAYDRRYFARPARSLFGEIRCHFAINDQLRVYKVIERHVELAIEHLERLPADRLNLDGGPGHCHAHTRKGTPCQREPLPGRDYCPSHKHLEEMEKAAIDPIASLQDSDAEALEDEGVGVPA